MTSPSLGIKRNVVYHVPVHNEFVPSCPQSCSYISIVQRSQIFSSSTNTYLPFWKHASEACQKQGMGRNLRLRAKKVDRLTENVFYMHLYCTNRNFAYTTVISDLVWNSCQNSPKTLDFSYNVYFVFITTIINNTFRAHLDASASS